MKVLQKHQHSDRSPRESLPLTEVSMTQEFYTHQIIENKRVIKQLEGKVSELEKENKEKDEKVAKLKEANVALIEENIQLRAKVTGFQDLKELTLGIEKTAELLNHEKEPETTTPHVSQYQNSLFNEIDSLKEQLDKKKSEFKISLLHKEEAPDDFKRVATVSTPRVTTKNKISNKAVKKPGKTARRGSRKPTNNQYVPSYLRQHNKKNQ